MFRYCLSPLLLIVFLSTGFAAESVKRMVIIGDSLTEGYGVTHEEAYPALLQTKIEAAGKKWAVVNAGISNSTSASALSRVQWQMKHKPDMILLALGANDGLRGTSTKSVRDNLAKAIELCQRNSVQVILVGIQVPPNYGADYKKAFDGLFPELAKKYKIPLVPFLLEGVAGEKTLNQSDGIHPNVKGHEIVANTIFRGIQKYL
jgi:acyl-CoA thioesterase I